MFTCSKTSIGFCAIWDLSAVHPKILQTPIFFYAVLYDSDAVAGQGATSADCPPSLISSVSRRPPPLPQWTIARHEPRLWRGINSTLIPLLSLPALCSASSLSCTQAGPYFANMIRPKWAEAASMAPEWGQPNPTPVWDRACCAYARCTADGPKWQNPDVNSNIRKAQRHLKIEGKQAICLLT